MHFPMQLRKTLSCHKKTVDCNCSI